MHRSIGLVVGVIDLRVTSEVLQGGALRGREEGVVVRMKGRSREVVLMVVVVVVMVLLFLGVMIGGCLLHLEEEVWREEGRG